MKKRSYSKRTRIQAPAESVFRWHCRPGAFERLQPPWETTRILTRTGGVEPGSRLILSVGVGPFRLLWVAEHQDFLLPGGLHEANGKESWQFQDVQVKGPFSHWVHTHRVEADGNEACYLEDRIEYVIPLGQVGDWTGHSFINSKLEKLFEYRHRVTADDNACHNRPKGDQVMKILITGSSGFIGSALVPFLTAGGHQIDCLARAKGRRVPDGKPQLLWSPEDSLLGPGSLDGFDAVVHLAGENIASGRWTPERKARILESRSKGTRLLASTLAKLSRPPKVLISASAIGYYGNRGDEWLNEQTPRGSDFLATVCQEWEQATTAALEAGIRVVNLRIGVVLSSVGGALGRMLTPFRLGAGGIIGNGNQFMSWIALDDLLGVILHALVSDQVSGPVNAVSPNPVTNREFTRTLGRVLGRPTVFPLPAFAAKLAFGEMAEALLLSSQRVKPNRLAESGYRFRFPELEGALRHVLGK